MNDILIKNARIIDPALNRDFHGDIFIADGKIAASGSDLGECAQRAAEVIDASGLIAAPGFVDMHVHLRDPGFTEKEDIISGCKAAAAGGVTSLLAMPNTSPPVDSPETVRYILNKARGASAHVYTAACVTKGLEGAELTDIDALQQAGACALSDDGRPVIDTSCLIAGMKKAAELNMLFTAHCEDLFLAKNWIMNEGEISERLGIRGVPAAAEDCGTAREIAAAAACGLPVHICHVSTAGSAAMIRDAKRRGVRVTAETAPHYLLLTEKELVKKDADYRMNPPLRTEEDRLALTEAVRDGTIDAIATDHAPHTEREKEEFLCAPNGVIGMETLFAAAYTALVKPKILTLPELIKKLSVNPARLMGIHAGSLKDGAPADITLIKEEEWTVKTESLHGKSKNAIFKGMTLCGKVWYTIKDGTVVFKA